MKDRDRNAPCEIRVEHEVEGGYLSSLTIRSPCAAPQALKLEFYDSPLRDHLRSMVSSNASAECVPGDSSIEVTLNFGALNQDLLTLLTHNMRFHGRMLHHHPSQDRLRWPHERRQFSQSQSLWAPKEKQWQAAPATLADAIDELWPGHENLTEDWSWEDPRVLDLNQIWNQCRLCRQRLSPHQCNPARGRCRPTRGFLPVLARMV